MNLARYVKISVFVLGIGIGGTVYIIKAADGFSTFNTKLYEVELEDATGLYINSQVFMAGVPVGKIRKVDLQNGRALLKIAFFKDVEIRGDSRLSKQSSSLLGTSILALAPGTPETPILEAGARISAAPPAGDISAALATAGDLGAKIGAILEEFQGRHLELLAVSLQTINALGARINERSQAELDRVSRILESSALIAERLERLSRTREGDVDASLLEVRAALENIRQVAENVRKGEGTVGKAFTDEELYARVLSVAAKTEAAAEELGTALRSIDRLAANTERVVSDAGDIVAKANGLGVQVDVRSDYEFVQGRAVSGAAIRLDPRSGDRWYRLGVSGAPDGVKTTTTTTVDGNPSSTTVTAESGYYFDAELARIMGPLTLRGGLYENSAGFGFDLRPFPQLTISAELYDFGTASAPNLRSYLTVYPFFDPKGDKPWNWLYFRGGVRAALDERRDYFLGLGLRFADEEVRGLVGLVPLVGE